MVEKLAQRKQRSFSVLCMSVGTEDRTSTLRGFQLTAMWTHICPLVDIFALHRKDALAQIFATCPFPTDSKCDTPTKLTLFVFLSS